MPWLKNGDNAATYPRLMAVRADRRSDERTVNEVAGWLWRCFTQSAGHMTDYVCDIGTAEMLGGSRTRELVRLSKKTGLLTEAVVDGVPSYRLIEDPEFIHMRLKAEVMWDRQQRNDTRDPALRVPVLLRDGDNCRWCGVLVQWLGKTSARTGTLDHLVPGEAGTPATMIVSCKRCNQRRGDNVDTWDADHEMRPEPRVPRYGERTAKYLTDNGYPTDPNVSSAEQAAAAKAVAGASTPTATARPTSSSSSSAHRTSSEHAPSGAEATAPQPGAAAAPSEVEQRDARPSLGSATELGPNSEPRSDGTSLPGSGREGFGLGLEGTGTGRARGGRGRGGGRGGRGKRT